MKKAIIIGLILMIGLVGVVCATKNVVNREGNGPYIIELELNKGWNIIAGTIPNEGILSDSEIKIGDIKAMWYYSPLQKKYLQVHPNPESSALQQDDDDFVLTSAMWIYSNKAGKIKYSTLEDYLPLENRQLYSGWNFVTITPDMYKGDYTPEVGNEEEYFSWDEVKGSCNLEKIYAWDYENQDWFGISSSTQFKGYDFDDFLGNGMVVKVSSGCKLATPSTTDDGITTPPTLP